VITGFNTDIKHAERVFHVQTEDRGLGNPVVESLVYVGGEILLSKRSSYKEQISESRVDEKIVKEMMDLQHRRIIEAIRRGRFDGVKPGDPAPVEEPPAAAVTISPAAAAAAAAMLSRKSGPFPAIRLPASSPPPAPLPASPPKPVPARTESGARPPLSLPRPAGVEGAPSGSLSRSPSGAFPRTSPPQMPKPVSASSPPAPAGRATGGERSLDQVIIEYLASEAASEHLELSLMSGGELIAGESVPLSIRACTSLTEKPVAGAHVSVRVVSTVGPPQILFRGVTGSDGLVKATCTIPEVSGASAALIIAASSSLGNNEIKQLIRKRK
jgi:hypothetical protein